MVLKRPVLGSNGMVLLGEGTELNQKWIERLEGMGLDGVWVDGTAEQTVPLAEALAALDERFQMVADRRYMNEIKNAVRIHIEKLYSK